MSKADDLVAAVRAARRLLNQAREDMQKANLRENEALSALRKAENDLSHYSSADKEG